MSDDATLRAIATWPGRVRSLPSACAPEDSSISDDAQNAPGSAEAIPPDFIAVTSAIEQIVRVRDASGLIARHGCSSSVELRAVVEKARLLPPRRADIEAPRGLKAYYNHPGSRRGASRVQQRRDIHTMWSEAERDLWAALTSGTLSLSVVCHGGAVISVPRAELDINGMDRAFRSGVVAWHDARAPETHSTEDAVQIKGHSGAPVISTVDFEHWLASLSRSAGAQPHRGIREHSSAAKEAPDVTAAPAASDRTGTQGRPSSKHLVIAEFKRRVAAKQEFGNLTDTAKQLSKWLSETHPELAQLTPNSAANVLRSSFRENQNIRSH